MSEIMDRVCANCNGRYGQHYGGFGDPDFCVHEEFAVWRKAGGGTIRAKGLFLNSGKFREEHDTETEIKTTNPNRLFAMKKRPDDEMADIDASRASAKAWGFNSLSGYKKKKKGETL